MTRSVTLALGAAALALAVALATPAIAQSKKIAFFAASSQNGFNQATFEGVEERAIELGYEAEIFDGQFNASHQYSQIEDVLASGRFAGMIVAPNDPVGISGAFEQVIEAGVPIATVLFPIGPELNTLEPQVPGITATVASPPRRRSHLAGRGRGGLLRRQGSLQRHHHHRLQDLPLRQSPGSRHSRRSSPGTPTSRSWEPAKAGIRRIPR